MQRYYVQGTYHWILGDCQLAWIIGISENRGHVDWGCNVRDQVQTVIGVKRLRCLVGVL